MIYQLKDKYNLDILSDGIVVQTERIKRWSNHYDFCRACGFTVNKHQAYGYCVKCFPKTLVFKKLQESYRLRNADKIRLARREYNKRAEVIEKKKARIDLRDFGGNRERAIVQAGEICQSCGLAREQSVAFYGKDLFIFRKDGDKRNNSIDNLAVLCRKCCHREIKEQNFRKATQRQGRLFEI